MEYAAYLPFWDKLTKEQQQRLSGVIEYRTVKKGTHIHDSSAECLGLVAVKSGQLRAYILSEDGREITISRLFEYDVSLLSASCVMPDLQFNVMIEAEKDSAFWSIPACLFKNLMVVLNSLQIREKNTFFPFSQEHCKVRFVGGKM